MSDRKGGYRRKTRDLMRKHYKTKGKISITRYLQELKAGDVVVLKLESGYQKGFYHPRFHGRRGVIIAKKGRCYEVQINDLGKKKNMMVHPVHLLKTQ